MKANEEFILTLKVKKTKLMIFGTNNILKNAENISLTYA